MRLPWQLKSIFTACGRPVVENKRQTRWISTVRWLSSEAAGYIRVPYNVVHNQDVRAEWSLRRHFSYEPSSDYP